MVFFFEFLHDRHTHLFFRSNGPSMTKIASGCTHIHTNIAVKSFVEDMSYLFAEPKAVTSIQPPSSFRHAPANQWFPVIPSILLMHGGHVRTAASKAASKTGGRVLRFVLPGLGMMEIC